MSAMRALEVARENAATQGVIDRIEFRCGDLLEPLAGQRVRYLVSNPPYISDEQWLKVAPNVKDYEPVGALRGGVDGLKYIGPADRPGAPILRSTRAIGVGDRLAAEARCVAQGRRGCWFSEWACVSRP